MALDPGRAVVKVAFALQGVDTPLLDACGCPPTESHDVHDVVARLQPGSHLMLESATHVFASMKSFSALLNLAHERDIRVTALAEGIDTGNQPDRRLAASVSALASFEARLHSAASRAGQQEAARLGRTPGSNPKMTPAQKLEAGRLYEAGELTVEEIAARFGVARSAIYRAMRPPEIQHQTGLPPKPRRRPVR